MSWVSAGRLTNPSAGAGDPKGCSRLVPLGPGPMHTTPTRPSEAA
jgi:hypothetical protein